MGKENFIVYGKQPVIEALKSKYKIYQIWYAKDLQEKLVNQVLKLAQNKKIKLNAVNKNDIQKLSGPVVHQGIALEMEKIRFGGQHDFNTFVETNKNHFIVLLDQVQDPHNLGAILRSAEISGANAVVIPEKGSAQLNDTVSKISAGALFHLNIFKVNNLEMAIEQLNSNKVKTFALMLGSESSMYNKQLTESCAIIVGSEGPGVRKNISNLCTDKITIPQFGKVSSLNASVATAIVLYEVVRQRHLQDNS